jgi:hypothetical protein
MLSHRTADQKATLLKRHLVEILVLRERDSGDG